MGSSFNKAIFDDHIQDGLVSWAQKARNKGMKKTTNGAVFNHQDSPTPTPNPTAATHIVEMTEIQVDDPALELEINPPTRTN